ncbi:MAG: hypothetical protein JEY97_01520 [Bacteroidales bacterium]|nr:hypothetical protein [Bacteroidales bacterium]
MKPSSINEIKKEYSSRLEKYNFKLQKIKKQLAWISFLRLFVFLAGIVLVYFGINSNALFLIVSLSVSLVLFLFLVRKHTFVFNKKKYYENLVKINIDEIKAIDGDFSSFADGKEFIDHNHPFTSDLDIFGESSIFQYFNRTTTAIGKSKLAQEFSQPEKKSKRIKSKQEAVSELSKMIDWRQNFMAKSFTIHENNDEKEQIIDWLNGRKMFDKGHFKFIIIFVPILTFSMFFLYSFNVIELAYLILYLMLPMGIAGFYLRRSNKIHNQISKKSQLLSKYATLLSEIENYDFGSELLKRSQKILYDKKHSASFYIKKLSKITNAFDARLNMLVGAILNIFLLWDLLQIYRMENWQKKHKQNLPLWFEVIAEFDALSAFANFRFNNPNSVFPEISKSDFQIISTELGHPLIDRKERVDNDFVINDWKQFLIITGANMAGKSTYLRTVGVNLVLAMTGSTVCAKSFKFTPVEIFTSIRTKDSLQKNESYFYAELKRLQIIISKLNNGERLFIILDEILKGTNSKDKQEGSKALLKQLINLYSSGIIATHDLALGSLADIYPRNIVNHCFEVEIENEKLIFDYKLKNGISKNLNATFLMKQMGITM